MAARRSIAVSLLGRCMVVTGALLLAAPLLVPIPGGPTFDEFQLRCLAFVAAIAFGVTGYAIERRMFAGFLLYVAGTALSLLWHLGAMDLHNLGLAMVDGGFLALIVIHRGEFHRGPGRIAT